ncbi:TPA: hypothetical protein PJG65_004130 [Escherichia coli]|uniref:Uncharacterized protein n=1 Tax=Escherichia coli TaxID=562 RepID=A0A1V2GGB1_ECOLX|nr:hypothetical protein [Escherichia coli]EAB8175321.1 hypothetical protein [Salmonella enterica subsp. enterica serovar Enteritidis]ELF2695417.1 hypothetical protein [Escherichia coli]ELF2699824.1 hypothetical protein [Escherichia coli]ONG35170.1 hypothetical protein BXT93_09455 [Escherichia coli]HCU1436773.1 hypothetical protein [Escherichia coli]
MTLIENIYADRQLLVLLVATVIATVGLFIVPLYSITKLVKRKLSKLPTASHPSEQTPPGRGRSVLFPYPPTFAGSEHAQYLWQMLNQDYYQFQLAELQKLLAREGYTLSFRKDHRVILPSDVQSAIAKELIAKRERYLAPSKNTALCDEIAETAMRDGGAQKLLEKIITLNKELGWYIARPDTDCNRQAQVLPYRQMKITIRATKEMLTRDVVRCLRDIASQIREAPITDIATKATEAVDDGIVYEYESWLTAIPPGLFPDTAGSKVPQFIEEQHFSTVRADSCRHYIVLLQGIKTSSQEAMAAQLDAAAGRIAVGDSTGAEYDDDYGYAFRVFRPATEA